MCPEGELNPPPFFVYGAMLQSAEPPGQGRKTFFKGNTGIVLFITLSLIDNLLFKIFAFFHGRDWSVKFPCNDTFIGFWYETYAGLIK